MCVLDTMSMDTKETGLSGLVTYFDGGVREIIGKVPVEEWDDYSLALPSNFIDGNQHQQTNKRDIIRTPIHSIPQVAYPPFRQPGAFSKYYTNHTPFPW